MDNTEYKRISSGLLEIIIGAILISPLFYNTPNIISNFFGLIMFAIGILLIISGLLKFNYKMSIKRKILKGIYTLPESHSQYNYFELRKNNLNISSSNVKKKKGSYTQSNYLTIFGNIVIILAYGVITLTILGTLYVFFNVILSETLTGASGAGIVIGLGIMISGILYSIGISCKESGTKY